MKGFLQEYKLYEKNVLYLATSTKLHFALTIRSLGKHCFLPSLANRMIRMFKDEEMRKNEGKKRKENVSEGSWVKVNLNRTPRISD